MSFIHPGFLFAGLAAAALPVVLHLLLRQRSRVMHIGSVRFLKDVVRQHTRRRRVQKWILLALRVLAALLLAPLFARPYWDRSSLAGLDREVAVLIDRSASMRARGDGNRTVFDSALRVARRQLAGLAERTAIHVGLFDAGGVVDIGLDELEGGLAPGEAATDFGAALAWARDLMVVSGRPERKVVLITDLQQSGLDRSTAVEFPPDVELAIHDVGRAMAQNVSVEDCSATVGEIRPQDPVRVNVRLANGGALAVRNLPVTLELQGPQGRISRRQSITLAGGERRSFDFALPEIQTDGIYQGKIAIDHPDDLAADNTRWLAFEARHPDRLLLVDGQQGRSVYEKETYYLEAALRVRVPGGPTSRRSFEVEPLVWNDGEGFPSLAGFRAIVMANVGRLTAVDADRLQEFVWAGGNLLFFCGDQTRPEIIDRLRGAGLFSGTMARDSATGFFRWQSWQRDHPILRPFDDPQHGDLRRIGFREMVKIERCKEPSRVLARAGDLPLIIETPLGKGSTLLVSVAADRGWSDWPQQRLYVPLVRQMLAYLTGQLAGRRPVRTKLVRREGQQAGVFAEEGFTVVRNLDPGESQLARASEEQFREALGLPAADRKISAEVAALRAPAGAERPDESWTAVMWMLLAVLVAELLMATRVHA